MAGSLMDVFVKIGADTSGLESGIGKVKGLVTGGMKVIGAAVGAATTAVGAFGASAIKVGSEFDSSMSQVAATLGYTTDNIKNNVDGAGDAFDALRAKAEEAGRSTIFSASESAEGLNILAMSGFDAEQSIAMLDDVLHLAAAGSMDMASAAGYISGAMKGFADESKDSAYYADLMAKGATLANTSVSQLGEAMSAGAAGAAAYNQTADSMTVALLRLAEQGETGSAAGTALSAAMKDLYTGTDQAKKALIELGVDAYDPVTHEARDFNDVVNDLEASMEGMTDEEKNNYKQTIFGIQGLNAYNKMVVSSIDKQNEWAEALENSGGEAEKQYGTMTDNLEGDVAAWNSALDGFKIAITEGAMGSVREFVQFGTDGLSKITDAFKKGGLSGAVDAFSEVLTDAIGMITTKLPDFIKAGMDLLGAVGKGILDNLPQLTDAAVQIIVMLVQGIVQALPELAKGAVTLVTSLGQSLYENSGTLLEAGRQLLTFIWDGIKNNLPSMLQSGAEILSNLVNGFLESYPSMIEAAGNLLTEVLGYFYENYPKFMETGVNLLLNIVNGIVNNLPQIVQAVVTVITQFIATITQNLPQILQQGITILGKLIAGLIQAIPQLVAAIPQIIKAIVDTFGQFDWLSIGVNILEGIGQGILSAIGSVVDAAVSAAESIWDSITGFFDMHSPSRRMMWVGEMLDKGLANGIDAYSGLVDDAMSNITDIADVNTEANITANGGGSGYGNRSVTINVYGAVGQSEEKLADIVANKLRDQVISIGAMA